MLCLITDFGDVKYKGGANVITVSKSDFLEIPHLGALTGTTGPAQASEERN